MGLTVTVSIPCTRQESFREVAVGPDGTGLQHTTATHRQRKKQITGTVLQTFSLGTIFVIFSVRLQVLLARIDAPEKHTLFRLPDALTLISPRSKLYTC